MKKMNKNIITLMLAGALCTGAGLAFVNAPAASAEEPAGKTYALTEVFTSSVSGVIGSETVASKEVTAFTLKNGESVEYNNSLAYAWGSEEGEKYLNMTFSFKELNFDEISFVFENAPAQATKDDKSVNTLKFTQEGGALKANLSEDAANAVAITVSDTYALTIAPTAVYGEYEVFINTVSVGKMTNIGARFADADKVDTLVVKAKSADGVSSVVRLHSLNGQAFDNVKTEGENESAKKVVTDNAKPVLVVNDTISTFMLGTQFSLSYEVVDVLDTDPSCEKQYYQFLPEDTEPAYTSLSDSTYFMETTCYTDGTALYKANDAEETRTATTVYEEYGEKEFVAIRFLIGDDTYTGDNKATVDLAWYAENASNVVNDLVGTTNFLILDRNEDGPVLKTFNEADKQTYQDKIDAVAETKYVGENVELPSLAWMFEDNNGYESLEFMASYKTPGSSNAQSWSSTKDFDDLEISATEEGMYEFKIFVTDKAGNTMKAMLDGEEVDVTKTNVWDIEAIPSFTFTIRNRGMKAEEKSDKLDTKILGSDYKLSGVKIVGASDEESDAVLYTVDINKYNNTLSGNALRLTAEVLSGIKYADLQTKINTLTLQENETYIEMYLRAYVSLIANALGVAGDADAVAVIDSCFTVINPMEDGLTEEDDAWGEGDNKYKWSPDKKSFTAATEGVYVILADYWDEEVNGADRVAAYMVVEVDAEADEISGENNWLKNNMVSIILFSIAGVMLILIIILLLVKPSDETLEDVDKKAKTDKKD